MASEALPLLVFPTPATADRNALPQGRGAVRSPDIGRQRDRLGPQLAVLQQAIDAERLKLQQAAPMENPELVLVLEIAGTLKDFHSAVARISGLEFLAEWAEDQIAPDDDFFAEAKDGTHKSFPGRLFLLGTNEQALAQLLGLWNRYQQDPNAQFDRGLNKFRDLFRNLRIIRHWSAEDRIGADVRLFWQDCIDDGLPTIRFEIEAWHYQSQQKNDAARDQIQALVAALGGNVLSRGLIGDISYHGFLVELPAQAVQGILSGEYPDLVLSNRIMFFRPKAQSVTDGANEVQIVSQAPPATISDRPPIVALLDGLPLQNHPLLQGRLLVDDPDGWAADYPAKDRVHGTAMASLILYGELDGDVTPLRQRLYVRPILRADPNDGFNTRRREQTPDNVLLIDLVHRAVKHICEGSNGEPPAAPSIRVINLSVGEEARLFERQVSPWGRLLDWLSFKYSVLFIVSAGNHATSLELNTPSDSLNGLTADERAVLAFKAMLTEHTARRLIAPAEAVNALTVGALHADRSAPIAAPGRYDLFENGGLSPLSRIGHGFRRAIKPDILMPGGRVLYRAQMQANPTSSVLDAVLGSSSPGHRVAVPPLPGEALSATAYSRGTSNAAALASRGAVQIHETLESLRATFANAPGPAFDAVLMKALLVHGAHWGSWPDRILAEHPQIADIENGAARHIAGKDLVTRWLGYGLADVERAIVCTSERATLVGVGELDAEKALIFSAPLPPTLAGKPEWRRLTATVAWMTPINCSNQAYRRAKLWMTPPQKELRVRRMNGAHDKAALRGTIQHEVLEGDDAVAFVDGDRLEFKVNCAADAGKLQGKVRFAICVSLEVSVGSTVDVYQQIRERIAPPITVNAVGG
jgi:hypothetical protein